MTNKPMLSVEREMLESISSGAYCKPDVMAKLRALLDNPVLEYQYDGMTQAQAQSVSDGVDEILHGKPAVQHQGVPVAWDVCWADTGEYYFTSRKAERAAKLIEDPEFKVTPLFAEQPAPVAVTRSDKEDMLYDCAYRNGVMFGYGIGINGTEADYQKCINRLQEQIVEARRVLKNNPVAILLPERMVKTDRSSDEYDMCADAHNDCLDAVARLNGMKP